MADVVYDLTRHYSQPQAERHSLPLAPTPFIGRQDEIVAIAGRLADPACGLLTLVGPGGTGKTRLAVEVAKYLIQTRMTADSVQFVDLQPVTSGEFLVTTLANVLGVLFSGSEAPRDQLLRYLSGRKNLLLLDNFEQLRDSADLLADIVAVAPEIKLLVTSREALNLQEEWVWQVGGLQVPEQQDEACIESSSAVQLFVARARRTRQDFTLVGQEADVARICRLVDGMPLALELAASWIKVLSCAEVADEIQGSLKLLTTHLRNVPERHQNMQAIFDHSWALLTEKEQQAFARLSVFRGGFRREAAEQVAGASLALLAGLVDKSFLRRNAGGRYEIHQLMHQYAQERLRAIPDAADATQARHAIYFAGWLHRLQPALRQSGQGAALDEIGQELENLRIAWQWAVEHGRRDLIRQSMHSLFLFCHIRTQAVEAARLFALALERFEHEDSDVTAYLLLARIWMGWANGRNDRIEQTSRAIRLAFTYVTGDEFALLLWSTCGMDDRVAAEPVAVQEATLRGFLEIFTQRDQAWGVALMHFCLGTICVDTGRLDEAEGHLLDSRERFLRLGDRWAACFSNMALAWMCEAAERFDDAQDWLQEHVDFCAGVGDYGAAVFAPAHRARIALKQNDYRAARRYVAEAVKSHLENGSYLLQLHAALQSMVAVLVSEGRFERAAELSSFLGQHATVSVAPEMFIEAQKFLGSLAQELPPQRYREAVERGKTLHLRTILEQLMDELSENPPLLQASSALDALSERELEVLRLLAAGHSNRQIAAELFLTLNTVKSHIHHIYGKLGVASRTQAIARARQQGLV